MGAKLASDIKGRHKIRVLDNAMRGEIFWPKWKEVTDERREVHMLNFKI
jgi:hypothetical protein